MLNVIQHRTAEPTLINTETSESFMHIGFGNSGDEDIIQEVWRTWRKMNKVIL